MSTQLDCNVIAIDYRGFGDSTGSPSQEGVLLDARSAWDYVSGVIERLAELEAANTVKPEDMIMLAGQSLGTGVVSLLAGQLADDGPSG
jgi:abhydrolase domain-containing protein 12